MGNNNTLLMDFEKGVHGDLCFAILSLAKEAAERVPRSIFAFAVLQVCRDLCSYFEDEQGIPVVLAEKINDLVSDPLKRLVESECFDGESRDGQTALEDLISSMRILHSIPIAREWRGKS